MTTQSFLATTFTVADGTSVIYPFSFAGVRPGVNSGTTPYIAPSDVKVQELFDDAAGTPQVLSRSCELYGANAVVIHGAPIQAGRTIRIYRDTEIRFPLVEYRDLQSVSEEDLNMSARQAIFLAQENSDRATEAQASAERGPQLNQSGGFDFRGNRGINVGDAVDPQDAVTLAQVQAWRTTQDMNWRFLKPSRGPVRPTTRDNGTPLENGDQWFDLNGGITYNYYNGTWVSQSVNMVALAGPGGAGMVGTSRGGDAVTLAIQDILQRELPYLEEYGGRGDYVTDNGPALEKIKAAGFYGFKLGAGSYGFNDGVDIPTGFVVIGQGAPDLGFGTVDCKQFLRDGYRLQMPGSSMHFKGTGTKVGSNPQRTDEMSTCNYMVRVVDKTTGRKSTHMSGFAIIQDMTCFDANGITTLPEDDQRASWYDTGLYLDDSARLKATDVVVWGYMDKASLLISSKLGSDDPDYNTFVNCTFGGAKHGVAHLGGSEQVTHGLSGTRYVNCSMYTKDHHSRGRMTTEQKVAYYADADQWDCVWIDGAISATASVNGHYFHQCEIRTAANHAIRLGRASNVQFYGCVFEQAGYAGVPNTGTPEFIGSADVSRGVGFFGCRINDPAVVFNSKFAGTIQVPINISGDPLSSKMGVSNADRRTPGKWAVTILGVDGNVGDTSVQFTDNISNGSSGWRVGRRSSTGTRFFVAYENVEHMTIATDGTRSYSGPVTRSSFAAAAALNISGGAVTITGAIHAINDTESVLHTINGGREGERVVLRPAASGTIINIQRTGGNIRHNSVAASMELKGSLSTAEFIYLGGFWRLLSISNNL